MKAYEYWNSANLNREPKSQFQYLKEVIFTPEIVVLEGFKITIKLL
ncbi:hypothetical protein GCM10007199_40010 [Fictibacillus barbaricus]|nr:hypothetical protein GCM10007199_40010 [Fictibacillus barbaricus]